MTCLFHIKEFPGGKMVIIERFSTLFKGTKRKQIPVRDTLGFKWKRLLY